MLVIETLENLYFFTRDLILTTKLFFCSDSSVSQSSWDTIMECYKNRGRFLIEAILWWLIIALPINLASIFFSIQAPAYIHTDHINNATNNVNTSLGIMILLLCSSHIFVFGFWYFGHLILMSHTITIQVFPNLTKPNQT